MAEFKNASIRERVIDRCLSDQNRKYNTKDIMTACNQALEEAGEKIVTSLNTIRSDMRSIDQRWRAYGGAIIEEKDGRRKFYHYEKRDFSIFRADITDDELEKVNEAMHVLSRFQELPQFAWVNELNAHIKSAFLNDSCSKELISFEKEPFAEGKKHLPILLDAIDHRQVMDITFQPLASEAFTHTVHPYFIKEYHQRWFLTGWDEQSNELTTFALDHIQAMTLNEKEYIANHTTHLASHFDQTIGISAHFDQPVLTVKLWVSKEAYPSLEIQPLHESQRILEHWDDGSKIIQIEVKESTELIQTLLSFGERVVVIEPQSIHQKIQEHIWFAGENYNRFK